MADVAILAQQVQGTPGGYTVPGGAEILLKSLRVAYNGAGAVGSFVPVMQLVAPGPTGQVVSEYPLGSTLAAGASADVTWFPGVIAAPSSSGGSGIQYDVDNVGGSLQVEATGAIAADFTQPNSGGGDVVGFGTGINSKNGVYLTNLASSGQFVLTVESFGTGTSPSVGILIDTQGVSGASKAMDVSYGNSTLTNSGQNGIVVSGVSKTNAGHTTVAVSANDSQQGAADNIGVQGSAGNVGPGVPTGGSFQGDSPANSFGVVAQGLTATGDAVGVKASASASGAGNAYPIQCFVGATKVFQINKDGSIHGLTGQALTFDL